MCPGPRADEVLAATCMPYSADFTLTDDHLVDVLVGEVEDRRVMPRPALLTQTSYPPKSPMARCAEPLDVGASGDVGLDDNGPRCARRDRLIGDRLQLRRFRRAARTRLCPSAAEAPRDARRRFRRWRR